MRVTSRRGDGGRRSRSRRHLLYGMLIGALITAAGFLLAQLGSNNAL